MRAAVQECATVMADPYAAATGLIERSAKAYVVGVPEVAADDGLFGPASLMVESALAAGWARSEVRMKPGRFLAMLMTSGAAAALSLLRRRPGGLRYERGLAALRLFMRGGARYAGSAPRLFAAAGGQRQLLRDDLALQTARNVCVEHAVLGELSATANWRAIAEEIWPFVQGPPSTPIGKAEATWRSQRQPVTA